MDQHAGVDYLVLLCECACDFNNFNTYPYINDCDAVEVCTPLC